MSNQNQLYHGAAFLYRPTLPHEVFTPEEFTDEHHMIAHTAKNFIQKEVHPWNKEIEKQDFALVKSLLTKAGDLGLLAHSIPEKYGGLGLDKITKGLVGEHLGSAGGYSVAHSNHTCIATLPITYFGTQWQKEYYLPKLASGEFIGAYCLTEPTSGSDALSAKTTAKLNEEGTHYMLNGSKLYITNAAFSDTFIVYAKVDGTSFTAFIVEKDFPGITLGPEEQKMGIKGSSTTAVYFENCEVPVRNLLGEVGKGHHIALNVLNLGRFNLGSATMGASKFSMKLAIDYTKERKQFGKSIAEFTATKEKVGDMTTRIYAAESLQYRTASLLEDALGDMEHSEDHRLLAKRMMEYAVECAICKVYGSETLDRVADESLQLHGGYGYIKDYAIEQVYRDSRINRIFEGTNEINRLLIPMSLLSQASKGMVPLQELVEEASKALTLPATLQSTELSREQQAVALVRNIYLLSIGLTYQKYGDNIVNEQEALMKLADLAIDLYAMESAVLRTIKAIESSHIKSVSLKINITEVLVTDTLLQVEMNARKLLSSIVSGDSKKYILNNIFNRCSELMVENTVETKREIADAVNQAENYIS
ncbi:acyl-CoA dehydrogenase [Sporosarcina sp. P3]|uniref:acyl-CoA dehydrogenase family protein n=1 Tax=Sporosarcina sp. P3 TaxID=2048245 RepID=UPI000C16CF88|nr:acyl-CoA dehydrogenase family protein [Sporosarcina sp. P3]PID21467.1 acyl-CoA dehydrogenase [Sporosarcina sp. P3]